MNEGEWEIQASGYGMNITGVTGTVIALYDDRWCLHFW